MKTSKSMSTMRPQRRVFRLPPSSVLRTRRATTNDAQQRAQNGQRETTQQKHIKGHILSVRGSLSIRLMMSRRRHAPSRQSGGLLGSCTSTNNSMKRLQRNNNRMHGMKTHEKSAKPIPALKTDTRENVTKRTRARNVAKRMEREN